MARRGSKDETLTREDARAWQRHFPFPGWGALAFQALAVLAGNALVFWLLASGRLPGAGLILLVVIEFVLLLALANLAALPVPREHLYEPPKPWREQLFMLGFLVVWAGGAYSITLLMIQGWGDFLAYFSDASRWHTTGLSWAIGATTALALFTAAGDWLRYRTKGPPYMPALGLDVMSRLLTLMFGAIPFAVPFFVVTIGGFKGVEYVFKRLGQKPGHSIAAGLAMLAVGYGGFAVIGWLISTGVSGWATGYVLAKCLSELMVVAIPLVMREAAGTPDAPPRGA